MIVKVIEKLFVRGFSCLLQQLYVDVELFEGHNGELSIEQPNCIVNQLRILFDLLRKSLKQLLQVSICPPWRLYYQMSIPQLSQYFW